MNRSGFTTVEVMIASVLIIALVTAGAAGIRQMDLLTQVATTRTAHSEVRGRVLEALGDAGACVANLGFPSLPALFDDKTPIPISQIKDGALVLLENEKPAPPPHPADGMIYKTALFIPTPGFSELLGAGPGRTSNTKRFQAQLEIRGVRKTLKDLGGAQGDVVTRIPISAEFDQVTGKMLSCTIHPDEIDEVLVKVGLTQHTVRQCLLVDGQPIQTDAGLICRVQLPFQPQTLAKYPAIAGYTNGIPNCSSIGDGTWKNAAPAGTNYNTTLPIDLPVHTCSGKKTVVTAWHSMSKTPVEFLDVSIKKGTSNVLQFVLGGSAFVMLVVVAYIPVFGTIFSAAVLLASFIISLFKKCKSENFRFYAQVTSIGCV